MALSEARDDSGKVGNQEHAWQTVVVTDAIRTEVARTVDQQGTSGELTVHSKTDACSMIANYSQHMHRAEWVISTIILPYAIFSFVPSQVTKKGQMLPFL